MRIKPQLPLRVVKPNEASELKTPTNSAVKLAETKRQANVERARHAREYHTTQLQERLDAQHRAAAGLAVATLLSVLVSLALTATAGPVVVAAVWVIPSGLFGALASILAEIEQTKAEIRAQCARQCQGD